MDRVILHSDLNCFYASVEMALDPSLRDKAVAVCGSTETRHGIVLAKSEKAKRAGVKTGQANWQARQACPGLIIVPPQYDQYIRYSRLVRAIYSRYTDQIEPYGMDECWLDVTGSRILGNGAQIADSIRNTVRQELGLTVSVGVSFNKIFAKLGSDMKKPDAVTVLDRSCWREKIWPLPVNELLYVGGSTTHRLMNYGVYTIGDLARLPLELAKRWFGKSGVLLWTFANGLDTSRVTPFDYVEPVKSVGHGITCTEDLTDPEKVWLVMLSLAQDVGRRLREYHLAACGIQVYVRSRDLYGEQYQCRCRYPTQSPLEIARYAKTLFDARYRWDEPVRAVCVRAISLTDDCAPRQLDILGDWEKREKQDHLEKCIDRLRERFGSGCIKNASLLPPLPLPDDGRETVTMPGQMYM